MEENKNKRKMDKESKNNAINSSAQLSDDDLNSVAGGDGWEMGSDGRLYSADGYCMDEDPYGDE